MSLRILCFIDRLEAGGAQRQLVELAKEFKNKGHQVKFLTYHKSDFYFEDLKKNQITEYCIVESNYLKRIIKIRRFIRKNEFHVVLSFLEASNFMNIVSGFPFKSWKVIVGERSAKPQILRSFKLKFYRWMFFFADTIVANSKSNLELVYKVNPLLPKSKCEVIYNLVNIPDSVLLKEKSTINKTDQFNIIIGARHVKLKNLNGLIEAINLLPKPLQLKLMVSWYGDKSEDGSYERGVAKIKKYGLCKNFNFLPSTNDLYSRILEADAVCLLSFYEGFPNFVCEGMRLGKPIICTSVSDLPDLLTEDINGFFCLPNDVLSISNALKKVMSKNKFELAKIGEVNLLEAKRMFNKEIITQQYLDLFK